MPEHGERVNVLLTAILLMSAPVVALLQLLLWLMLWPLAAVGLLSAERLGWSSRRLTSAVWLHGASLGEWNALLPLVSRIGGGRCAGSYMSRNAERARVARSCADQAALPLDLWPAYWLRIARWRPDAIVLAEVDLWPVFLVMAWLHRIPIIWINARLDRSMGKVLAVLRSFYRCMLGRAVYIHAIDARTAADLRRWGYRVDQAELNLKWARHIVAEHAAKPDTSTLLLASIHADENDVIAAAAQWWQVDRDGRRVIVAPRQLSQLPELKALAQQAGARDWEFVERYGVMDQCYRRAGLVVVGGTFDDVGGHNPVEAAIYGATVICGPSVHGQLASVELLRRTGNVAEVRDADALRALLLHGDTGLHSTQELEAVLRRSAELADTVAAKVHTLCRYN